MWQMVREVHKELETKYGKFWEEEEQSKQLGDLKRLYNYYTSASSSENGN